MAVRLKDIARDLGLSIPAVSKALKGDRDISEATRERVLRRVRELNYQPNMLARGLITGRSNAIGLVVPALMPSFFAEIAQGVAAAVQARGYTLLVASSNEEAALEVREIENLLARNVDGLIVASAQRGSGGAAFFQGLKQRGRPFVLLDREVSGVAAGFVGLDNQALGRMATEHLVAAGCRRIAHITCPTIATSAGRRAGFLEALTAAGLKGAGRVVEAAANSPDAGAEAMRALLGTRTRLALDGVFCFSDPLAAGAMQTILSAGLRIPADVRVMGAGNVQFSDVLRVPLSTVDVNTTEAGARAAEMLMGEIEGDGGPGTVVRMPMRLIARESTSSDGS
jgi:LacI family transcriptional regulator